MVMSTRKCANIIRKTQIKAVMRYYHYKLVNMAKTKKTDTTKCWQGCEATETLTYCWWPVKSALIILGKWSGSFLSK